MADADQAPKEHSPILVTPGPNGLIIASEDRQALDQFEQLLRSLSSGVSSKPELTIFYLKHAKASSVAETLNQILSGASTNTSSGPTGGGSLIRDIAGAALGDVGGGIVGSLLGGGGTIQTSGSVSITADTRLNALIVQASATDVETVNQLLRILDQKESPEEVLVQPKPRPIPVYNTQADEIANVVRQVYQDRMVTGSGAGGPGGRPSPEQFMQLLQSRMGGRGGRGGAAGRAAEEVQRMSIGVDARSNSLIVAAPDDLFQEVKELVEMLDNAATESDEAMEVVPLQRTNSQTVQQALSALMGDSVTMTRGGGGGRSSGPGAPGFSGSSDRSGRGGMNFRGFSPQSGGGFGGGQAPFGNMNFGGGRGSRSFQQGGQATPFSPGQFGGSNSGSRGGRGGRGSRGR